MTISLSDAGKRYNRDWIFRHFTFQFSSGTSYAITGPNGSGKSTLLQSIGGAVDLSEGKLNLFSASGDSIAPESLYRQIALAAPYLELVEEMTVTEFLGFHQTFKPFLPGLSIEFMIQLTGLSAAAHKQIRYYSSGMKQRVKLLQALFTDVPVILLDEPCTNLDQEGVQLYRSMVDRYCSDRLLIVSSNDETEYSFCTERISITAYK